MTIETRTTLELGDIQAIEFECGSCHTKIVFPIGQFKDPPTRCSACGERSGQWLVHGNADFSEIKNLVFIIQSISTRKQEKFAMRFQITNFSASREASGQV
jgi:DNA replicative helicase MCM subunit Mcm2 (Cdc46/Mcm family)